jgi:transposase
MRMKSGKPKEPVEKAVKDIRRKTRRQFGAEEKTRIVLEGLRGEESIAELCRREGIAQSLYYSWSKEFLEAGKRRLAGDTARQATAPEVKELRAESSALKEAVADLTLENRLLKKSMLGPSRDIAAQCPAGRRMGATTNEVSRIREARDHPHRRAVASAGEAHAGLARHSPHDVSHGGMIDTCH